MASDMQDALEQTFAALRPKLHRYCARMTGSVIDGEDLVQETFAKAMAALPQAGAIANLEGWLFRIVHNAALDVLRSRARQTQSDEDPDMIADPVNPAIDREIAAASLRTFMRLSVRERSSVILTDVLGYSLAEAGNMLEMGMPALKAALHRGRGRLRELAREPDDTPPPVLSEPERSLLAFYVEAFNGRDFDAIRDRLADEVKVEVVNRSLLDGKRAAGRYFTNYAAVQDWRLAIGLVDRDPAVLVLDPAAASGRPVYFKLLRWAGDRVVGIRDFRYARYAVDGAEVVIAR